MEDPYWIVSMQSEQAKFKRNKVCRFVPKPHDVSVIRLKWIFKNKTDKEGNIVRNKARLVVKGYSQQEGKDYEETFAHVADSRLFEPFQPIQHKRTLMFIKWMLSVNF